MAVGVLSAEGSDHPTGEDGRDTRDPGLYECVLGTEWKRLDAAVQRMHATGRGLHAAGDFRVSHGKHRAARLLARLLRLPAESEKAEVRLHIEPRGPAEFWRRTFDGRPMVTRQSSDELRTLIENTGILELRFRLAVEDGALHYRPIGVGVRIGWLFLPLPRWLGPVVAAREKAADGPNAVSISVMVTLPGMGLLISYAGRIEARETET